MKTQWIFYRKILFRNSRQKGELKKIFPRAIHKSAFKFADNTRNPKILQTICRKFAVGFAEYAAGWRGGGRSFQSETFMETATFRSLLN